MNFYLASRAIIPTANNATVIGDSLGHRLTLSKGKYHNLGTKTIAENLGTCVKLTAWAGKNKFEANSAPEIENIDEVAQVITRIVEGLRGKMRNSFDEVHAFITGGVEYNPRNAASKKSLDLIEEMFESLYKEGVPTTVVAAQKGDGIKSNLNTIAHMDKMFIYGKPVDRIINSNKNNLEEALNDHFDYVEISREIPIKIAK